MVERVILEEKVRQQDDCRRLALFGVGSRCEIARPLLLNLLLNGQALLMKLLLLPLQQIALLLNRLLAVNVHSFVSRLL